MTQTPHWTLSRLASFGPRHAVVSDDAEWTYQELSARILAWKDTLAEWAVLPGDVVAVYGDFHLETCSLLFALTANRNVIAPLGTTPSLDRREILDVARARHCIRFNICGSTPAYTKLSEAPTHALLEKLRREARAGLILFSSGSTGDSKAILLDLDSILEKFKKPSRSYRTLAFLLQDHIGGINTLLSVLLAGGTLVLPQQRSIESICGAIARHHVELLPTTPTFVAMLLMADAGRIYSLTSLQLITYGTEPMPESTLRDAVAYFPTVRFKQTYGLSELGIIRTRSEGNDSLWMQVGGDGVDYKVVDGVLWIRTASATLGYLNSEGDEPRCDWFNTADVVDVKVVGEIEYIRVRGRQTEIINVAGQKVYPTELESWLRTLPNIRDATVFARSSAITGQVVAARIALRAPEDLRALRERVRAEARRCLDPHKIPIWIEIDDAPQPHTSARFKKVRRPYHGSDSPT